MERVECIETYMDLVLKEIVTKNSNVNELYEKQKVELTEERISYLVDDRHLCKRIKSNSKTKQVTAKKTTKKDTKK